MAVTQHFQNPSFSFGQVDDQYAFRADVENLFIRSCKRLKNFDVLSSGAVQRRGKTVKRFTRLGVDGFEDVKLVPYRRSASFGGTQQDYILLLHGTTSPNSTHVTWYNLTDDTTGSFTLITGITLDLERLKFAQVGNSLFLTATADGVYRMDDIGQEATLVGFWFEVSGLWDGVKDGLSVTATSGVFTKANEEVGDDNAEPSATDSEILVVPPSLAADADPWKDVDTGATSAASPIVLGTGLDTSFNGAKLYGRYVDGSQNPNDVLAAQAIAFARNRLIMGGILDLGGLVLQRPTRISYGFQAYEPTRVLMSGVGKPYVVFPAFPQLDDSPLDFNILAQNMQQILWISSTETAIYFGSPSAITVMPANVNFDGLANMQTIDKISVGQVQPEIWNNGIVYIGREGDRLFWMQFSFQRGSQQQVTLNKLQPSILEDVVDIDLVEPGSNASWQRRIMCVNGDGSMSIAFDNEDDSIGWSTYDFPYPVDSVGSINSRPFVAVRRGDEVDVLEIVADNEYVGDYETSVVQTGPNWTVQDSILYSSLVAITGEINGDRIYVDTFNTSASGVVTRTDFTDPDNPVEVDVDLSDYTSILAYLPFESDLIPFNPTGIDQEGLSYGRMSRIVEIRPYIVNTRQIKINDKAVKDNLPLSSAGQRDYEKTTGWLKKGDWGHDVQHDTKISGYAVYQAIVAGLVREVST